MFDRDARRTSPAVEGGELPQEPRWPESHAEQTDILPVVTPGFAKSATTGEPAPPQRSLKQRRGFRKAALIGGGVFGLLVVAYAIDVLVTQGSVPRGVTVAGVEVGGMDRTSAEQELRGGIEPRLTRPVKVVAGDVEESLAPKAAGLRLDWPATLDQAGDQPLNPITRIASFFSSSEVGVVTHSEDEKLAVTLENLRDKIDREPVEGTIKFEDAKPVAVEPKAGQKLDVEAAKQAILERWASGDALDLAVTQTPVKVSPEAVQAALEQVAKPAVSGPLLIKGEAKDATVEPEAIAGALTFEPADGGVLNPKIDNNKIIEAAGPQLKSTEKQGKDAQIVFEGGRPSVQPSEDAKLVDWEPSLKPVLDVLKRTDVRELPVTYKTTPAKLTTDQANQLGIKEVVSEYKTSGFAPESGVNIRVAAEKINGSIVKPNETFSLNGATAPRGAAQGYVEAGVIKDGAPGRDIGGGVSQLATTIYNAAYFAGLKDTEHKEHSYYISRYPAAREATVYLNPNGASVIDLKFTNDTETGVAIQTIWTPSDITIRLWGTKKYNVESIPGGRTNESAPPTKPGPAENCKPGNGAPGFTTSDTRVVRDAATGREVRRHTRNVHYNPQPKITCGTE